MTHEWSHKVHKEVSNKHLLGIPKDVALFGVGCLALAGKFHTPSRPFLHPWQYATSRCTVLLCDWPHFSPSCLTAHTLAPHRFHHAFYGTLSVNFFRPSFHDKPVQFWELCISSRYHGNGIKAHLWIWAAAIVGHPYVLWKVSIKAYNWWLIDVPRGTFHTGHKA